MYRFLFGPVPSRRLGLSLGVDMVPCKTCSYNCLFCEVGLTTDLTTERREYVPLTDLLGELRQWIKGGGKADFITLAGSGEPTLHSRFGEVISAVKEMSSIPVALLSNGSLFHIPAVRSDAAKADIVKVSLSAWDQHSFEKINRPHGGLQLAAVVEGFRRFRKTFNGRFWLEVVLVAGFNDDAAQVKKIAKLARGFQPDRIHLNTVARPGADRRARAVDAKLLAKLADEFIPRAEVICEYDSGRKKEIQASNDEIVAVLKRRPCTCGDLCAVFALEKEQMEGCLERLQEAGLVNSEKREGKRFFFAGRQRVVDARCGSI